ncbi:hypothetical protein [Janibacter sp. G56]|uniref:hypothetical protein n=1 Tax=Janibacter sp. G56 TaxID=3418717 RepID=UPI003D05D4AF
MKLTELAWADHPDADDVLLDITGCTVSVLVRGRNAWRSIWVRHWFHNSHLFADHRSAQLGAESLRERGSKFYVRDRPALVLHGTSSRIVVFDGFDREPFKYFDGITEDLVSTPVGGYYQGVFPGSTLREAVDAFRPGSRWWARGHHTENDVQFASVSDGATLAGLRAKDLQATTSQPQGSGYYLGWSTDTQDTEVSVEITTMRRHVRRWQSLIENVVAEGAPVADTLRTRFGEDSDPARSRPALRERFAAAIEAAAVELAAADLAHDLAVEAGDLAGEELDEAMAFAEDPWAHFNVTDYETSTEIRQARERAQNAQQLVTEAERRLGLLHERVTGWVTQPEWRAWS